MSVSVLNDNRGFELSLCPKIHLKGTLNSQGNFTFKNNCAFLVQLLSVYVMVSLDSNTSYFYSRVPGLHSAKDVLLQNQYQCYKVHNVAENDCRSQKRQSIAGKERSQDQVSKKMHCKKFSLCKSSFCLASHF